MITTKHIAAEVDKTTQAVRDAAKDLGIEKRFEGKRQVFTEGEAEQIIAKLSQSNLANTLPNFANTLQSALRTEADKDMLDLLKSQRERDAATIDELREALAIERQHSREKADEIAKLAADLATALNAANNAVNNAQLLHGGTMKQQLALPETSGGYFTNLWAAVRGKRREVESEGG